MRFPRILATLVAVMALVAGVLVPSTLASASTTGVSAGREVKTTLVGFDPGNLISDSVFFNANAMSASQIQTFLNSKVSTCRSGGDEYGPYVCLKDYKVSTQTKSADQYCRGYEGATDESAAQIIAKVGASCGINPQVLLVMLQKEQSLVLNVWPSAWRYEIAMGHDCPDFRACNPAKKGFLNQVYGAARQMQIYAEGKYFTYYAPGKTWNIRYSPDVNCGSSPVYVANIATSAMYYYTPYQPNAAALAAGTGEAPCGAYGNRNFYNYFTDWFGSTKGPSTQGNPVGFIDSVSSGPGEIKVSGWALDPDSSASISVHAYISGVGYPTVANLPRTDLAAHYPGLGTDHGYVISVPPPTWGNAEVCLYGINIGQGSNQLIGCTTVFGYGGSPMGYVDEMTAGPGTVSVSGWALDPDTKDPIEVHVYIGSAGTSTKADKQRTDVANAYPAYGAAHGYATTVKSPAGYQTICVYGINVKTGSNVLLEPCRQMFVKAASDPGSAPFGSIDSFDVVGNTVTVRGWSLDSDTPESTAVHVYVGNSGTAHLADGLRTDIAAAYPGYGEKHGFAIQRALPAGGAQVCVYAINDGRGSNTQLGCRFLAPAASRAPFGNVDSFDVQGSTLTVRGWALDSDTKDPIGVHVYVGGSGSAHEADGVRSDIASAYPGYGEKHGFAIQRTIPSGGAQVCVYAINDGSGDNTILACRLVMPAVAAQQKNPIGSFDGLSVANGRVSVSGWALDPDTADPIAVHLYVGGTGYAFTADADRPDISAAFPAFGPRHGFAMSAPITGGARTACVYAINNAAGDHTLLGCRAF